MDQTREKNVEKWTRPEKKTLRYGPDLRKKTLEYGPDQRKNVGIWTRLEKTIL